MDDGRGCVPGWIVRGPKACAPRSERRRNTTDVAFTSLLASVPETGVLMFDYLIVGAGFAGSVLAERLAADAGRSVLICDKRPHIGGNAYDHYNEDGVLVHKYGPHIFHTNARSVY